MPVASADADARDGGESERRDDLQARHHRPDHHRRDKETREKEATTRYLWFGC